MRAATDQRTLLTEKELDTVWESAGQDEQYSAHESPQLVHQQYVMFCELENWPHEFRSRWKRSR
jgi:hypothetical protein